MLKDHFLKKKMPNRFEEDNENNKEKSEKEKLKSLFLEFLENNNDLFE
jgi:hypothetical protein